MIGILVKKQLMEVFRGYFYNQKKNKARSKGGTIAMFIGFALLMVGLLGGMFTGLSLLICGDLVELNLGWMYFLIMGLIALLLAVFGSVFNTYSGLYKAKDNDLLLAMPIRVRDIMVARLLNVYLMGLMYSSVVILPAVIVYWVCAPFSIAAVIGCIALILFISLIALVMSCALGWCVAVLSSKLKHKSFVTVIISLIAFAAYYFVCFRLNTMITTLLQNALIIGEKIQGKAYLLYLIGRMGEGYLPSILVCLAAGFGLVSLCGWLMSRSFLKLATVTDQVVKKEYKESVAKQRGMFATLLSKEFGRFTSSANYMLNAGLGTVFILLFAAFLLFKGKDMAEAFTGVFGPEKAAFLFCLILAAMGSSNDMAAPSVSLEGKNIWILQSLPIDPVQVLLAKLSVQLIITEVPLVILTLVATRFVNLNPLQMVLFILFPLVFCFLIAAMDLSIGLRLANLTWTNELAPIKQSAAVAISLFGGWAIVAAIGLLFMWKGSALGFTAYVGIWLAVCVVVSAILMLYLVKRGGKRFAELR